MGVLHQALRAGQPVVLAVAPFDAGLHEGRLRVGQHRGHGAAQPVGRRHEIGIEHRNVGRIAERHAGRQGARLEAGAVGAPDMIDIDAFAAQADEDAWTAISDVRSVLSSSSWIVSRSRGQSSAAAATSARSTTTGSL